MTFKQLAIATARQAGAILRDNLGQYGAHHAENKSPFDYVTEVDRTCEQFIINSISEHFPNHEILSEESGRNKNENEFCWIVDPLDGTTNFIHGIPHIAISIALQQADKIILGVVYDPFRDEMFYAERGKGAYCNEKLIHVSQLDQINHCLIATGFPFRCKELLDEYWKVLSAIFMAVSGIRRTGSAALDLAYVACGRFDGFWELRLSPWDIAAGSLLIEEAGGKISDFEGKDNHIWVGDVVASNGRIHDFILGEVKKVFPLNP